MVHVVVKTPTLVADVVDVVACMFHLVVESGTLVIDMFYLMAKS